MNLYKSSTNESLAGAAPLFSSVWLALFYVLRKNFNERIAADTENLDQAGKN